MRWSGVESNGEIGEEARCGAILRRYRGYCDVTAQSDRDSFQNIGVATLGWNSLMTDIPIIIENAIPWRR